MIPNMNPTAAKDSTGTVIDGTTMNQQSAVPIAVALMVNSRNAFLAYGVVNSWVMCIPPRLYAVGKIRHRTEPEKTGWARSDQVSALLA